MTVVGTAAAGFALAKKTGLVSFGQRARSGGGDPFCKGHGSTGDLVVPVNSGQRGAPPDFRKLTSPSPSGDGLLKDDACDGVPVEWNARHWVMGDVRNGRLIPGGELPSREVLWVEVSKSGEPVELSQRDRVESRASAPKPTVQDRGFVTGVERRATDPRARVNASVEPTPDEASGTVLGMDPKVALALGLAVVGVIVFGLFPGGFGGGR